ncbi:MAG: diguanylate cyclase [Candidatus Omnitrophica bacterium]|nr:diguanylate cyclase [Candidatus Omnitrophota bacterium]
MYKDIRILIIDDDPNICESLKDILSEEGYEIATAGNIAPAKEDLAKEFYNVVLLDLKFPNGSGLDLLKELKASNSDTAVIVFTGYASAENAIAALNEGAFSYMQKPLNIDELKITIKKAIQGQELMLSNKDLLNRLKELSVKDPLTGLYNYRYLEERLSSEFKRAHRYVLPLSVIMIDIDYFKSINDIYGHQYGDLILKEFGQCLRDASRTNDIVVRYGGEEFLALLPDTNKTGAVIFGNRLLEKLVGHVFDPQGQKIKLKISMGLVSFPEDGVDTEMALTDLADKTLRTAKEAGGNRLATLAEMTEKQANNGANKGEKESVEQMKEKLLKMEGRVNQTLLESIYAFAKTIEAKDYYTSEHGENMVSIAVEIGKKLNISEKELENLKHAAILHDLGKIGIPDKILHKKGKLNENELKKIRAHPQIGAEIIRSVHFLSAVVPIVLHHHERFDGLGYSSGLKGKDILLGARIIAVADVYQALVSDRPYRKAYSKREALKIIQEGAGTQFDPEIVKIFLEISKSKSRGPK